MSRRCMHTANVLMIMLRRTFPLRNRQDICTHSFVSDDDKNFRETFQNSNSSKAVVETAPH
eukprot:417027-Amphidinium_carterae.1